MDTRQFLNGSTNGTPISLDRIAVATSGRRARDVNTYTTFKSAIAAETATMRGTGFRVSITAPTILQAIAVPMRTTAGFASVTSQGAAMTIDQITTVIFTEPTTKEERQ